MTYPARRRIGRTTRTISLMMLAAIGTTLALWRPWTERGADANYDTSVSRPALKATSPRVYFDHGHRNSHSIYGRFSPFALLLRADGCIVETGSSLFEGQSLANYDVLVIVNAKGPRERQESPAFAPAEVTTIKKWVENGGSLLLAADHHPCGPAAADLAKAFGITMMCGWCEDPQNLHPDAADTGAIAFRRDRGHLGHHPILDHATEPAITCVVTFTGQSLVAPESAFPLLLCAETAIDMVPTESKSETKGGVTTTTFETTDTPAKGHCQALAMTFGKGRVVCVGEAAMLSAQLDAQSGLPFGMNVPNVDNRQFVLNTIRWLAHAIE